MPVIGFLGLTSADVWADNVRAFKQGLSETGYVEGQNVAIEYRWAEDQNNRLPALAADLVSRRVTVIVAGGATPAAMAAKSATATIPIVFQIGTDPVALGIVSSLSRPGGNLTGVSSMNQALGQKRLEVLRVPRFNSGRGLQSSLAQRAKIACRSFQRRRAEQAASYGRQASQGKTKANAPGFPPLCSFQSRPGFVIRVARTAAAVPR
jgi:hypothetical protein